MKKYLQIIKTTWQEYSVYRLNFIMWRIRNIFSILIIYFLWLAIFSENNNLFGYDKTKMVTYILGISLMQAIIFASRTIDVGGEIAEGNLTNYLLRPFNFIKWWFTKDLADKVLNLIFSVCELAVLFFILRPVIFIQQNAANLSFFLLAIVLSTILYFFINFFLGIISFWTPESWGGVWAPRFIFMVILQFLSGSFFPLDILPQKIFFILSLTPFPYLLYFPLKVYLGGIGIGQIILGVGVTLFWTVIWYFIVKKTWTAGLKVYGAEGR